ncbi:MAG: phenylalanine--tRNA ligase subunit alpha, partial [Acidaminococcaceae bacterium]|nr:phenylalanine--tRNA ligase subunit alpha [Acidaminococcaceae bacterium]
MSMRDMLLELKEKALADLEAAASSQELQDLKVKYLGRKGPMTEILRGMGKVPAEDRPKIGEIVNQVKQTLEQCLKDRTEILRAEALKAKIANDKVDITLPGRKPAGGHLHPITLTAREIKKIFMH